MQDPIDDPTTLLRLLAMAAAIRGAGDCGADSQSRVSIGDFSMTSSPPPNQTTRGRGIAAAATAGRAEAASGILAAITFRDPMRPSDANTPPLAPENGRNATGASNLTPGVDMDEVQIHDNRMSVGISAFRWATPPPVEHGAARGNAAATAATTASAEESSEVSMAKSQSRVTPTDALSPAPAVTLPYQDEDVLCVRGGLGTHHKGNKWYRQEAAKRKQEYQNKRTKPKRKRELRDEVIAAVHDRGGHFLKREEGTGKERWMEVPLKGRTGLEKKVGQLLSEKVVAAEDSKKSEPASVTKAAPSLWSGKT